MACHTRRFPIVFSIQGQRWHLTLDVVRLRMLPNADDGMPFSTLSDHVYTIKGNVKLNGIKHFNHKICYLTLNLTFSDVLPRYFELKNLCSFIRFIAIKNNYFF